jgi:hypothetical protein
VLLQTTVDWRTAVFLTDPATTATTTTTTHPPPSPQPLVILGCRRRAGPTCACWLSFWTLVLTSTAKTACWWELCLLLHVRAGLLTADGVGWGQATPLIKTAQNSQLENAAFLIGRGADLGAVDQNGDTAFHWSCNRGLLHLGGCV